MNLASIERLPPHDIEAKEAVVAALKLAVRDPDRDARRAAADALGRLAGSR